MKRTLFIMAAVVLMSVSVACGNSQKAAQTNQTGGADSMDSGLPAAPATTEKQPVPTEGQRQL